MTRLNCSSNCISIKINCMAILSSLYYMTFKVLITRTYSKMKQPFYSLIRSNLSYYRACVKHGHLRGFNCVRFGRARPTSTSPGKQNGRDGDSETSFASLVRTSYSE